MLLQADPPCLQYRCRWYENRGDSKQQPGQPRWYIVHEIIEPSAAPAEAYIGRRFVANHRIHGAGQFEEKQTREAGKHIPKKRTQKSINEVLAQAFDCCTAACV